VTGTITSPVQTPTVWQVRAGCGTVEFWLAVGGRTACGGSAAFSYHATGCLAVLRYHCTASKMPPQPKQPPESLCPPPPASCLPAECLHDLLECAARLLRLGGRLVYFFPAAPGFYSDDELAKHPTLQVDGVWSGGGWYVDCLAGSFT
jgi:hypothetical protein